MEEEQKDSKKGLPKALNSEHIALSVNVIDYIQI